MTHTVNAKHPSSQGIEPSNPSSASPSHADVAAFESKLSPGSGSPGSPSSSGALTNHQNTSSDTLDGFYDHYGAGGHSANSSTGDLGSGPMQGHGPLSSAHSSTSSLGLPIQGHGPVVHPPHGGSQGGTAEGSLPPVGTNGGSHGAGGQAGPHFAANHSDAEMGIGSGTPAHAGAQTEAAEGRPPNAGSGAAHGPSTQEQGTGAAQGNGSSSWFARHAGSGDRFDKALKPFTVPIAAVGGLAGIAGLGLAISKARSGGH